MISLSNDTSHHMININEIKAFNLMAIMCPYTSS